MRTQRVERDFCILASLIPATSILYVKSQSYGEVELSCLHGQRVVKVGPEPKSPDFHLIQFLLGKRGDLMTDELVHVTLSIPSTTALVSLGQEHSFPCYIILNSVNQVISISIACAMWRSVSVIVGAEKKKGFVHHQ
jgi:hypothetical protein